MVESENAIKDFCFYSKTALKDTSRCNNKLFLFIKINLVVDF